MKTWTFPSSSGGDPYTTKLADDGKLLCNCRGWTMRRGDKPRHCKHTKKVALDAGSPVVERGEFVYLVTTAVDAIPTDAPMTDVVDDARPRRCSRRR